MNQDVDDEESETIGFLDDDNDDNNIVDWHSSTVNDRRKQLVVSLIKKTLIGFFALFLTISVISSVTYRPSITESSDDRTFGVSSNVFGTVPKKIQKLLSKPALSLALQNDLTFDDKTCRTEFPLLYPQLQTLQIYWKAKKGITRADIDENDRSGAFWGHVRLLIRDGQVFIRKYRNGPEFRHSSLLNLIQQAIATWPSNNGILPPIDLVFSAGDKDAFPGPASWTIAKRVNDTTMIGQWLLPDFGFGAWPDAGIPTYREFLQDIKRIEQEWPWHKKYSKAFWRGYPNDYKIRADLLQRTDADAIAERSKWADVFPTSFHGPDDKSKKWKPLVKITDHCQHKYLIQVEGNSYSGRSRYILACHAVVIAHPLEWTQHFHPVLNGRKGSRDQNYVELPGPGFSGLEEEILALRASDGLFRRQDSINGNASDTQITITRRHSARRIADNASRTLRNRYLTPAATMCYLRAALQHYSASMDSSTWGDDGLSLLPGRGINFNVSRGKTLPDNVQGDIEASLWRLIGEPEWPPPRPPSLLTRERIANQSKR